MAITGMILVEQLYRNTPAKQRWGIKFACLGIGGIFAYDFYLYSDALLLRHMNPDIWAARGIINALVVPLVAMSAARNPQWSIGITVSRRILFYSAALFGAAVYCLPWLQPGYYFRFFGGSWGTVMQVTFLFGAAFCYWRFCFPVPCAPGSEFSSASISSATTTTTAKNGCGLRALFRRVGTDWRSGPSRLWRNLSKVLAGVCGFAANQASANQ